MKRSTAVCSIRHVRVRRTRAPEVYFKNMNLHKLNPFSVYRGLPRPVYVIFIATVVNGTGIFVYPFLTLFLTQRLGYDPVKAGLYLFVASLAYFPGSLIGGKLSDTAGRRIVMIVSQTLASATFVACGFLGTSEAIPFLVLANLFFDGITDPARSAVMNDVTVPENRQSAFALTYLGHNLGYSVGPLLAGFLFRHATEWLFFGNAIIGFLAMALMVSFVGETKPDQAELDRSAKTDESDRAVEGSLLQAFKAKKSLVGFAALMFLYQLAYEQTIFSLPLTAVAVFGDSGAAVYGTLMSVNALVVIFLNAPLVSLTRRFSTLGNVAFAGILYGLGYLGYAFAKGIPLFWLCTVFWTLGEIVDAVNTWAYMANETPKSHRGRFGAVLHFVSGSGRWIGPAAGGKLIAAAGVSCLWALTSLTAFTAAAGVRTLDWATRKKQKGKA